MSSSHESCYGIRVKKSNSNQSARAASHALGPAVAKASKLVAHDGPPLSKAEQTLLATALERSESTRNAIESTLVEYGRWLLVHVFGDDTRAAIEHRQDNPVWTHLLRRAGGATLRLSPRFLTNALLIATYDKRLNDGAWKALDPGRKEILLPLKAEKELREAAKHVLTANLSTRKTREFVEQLRESNGVAVERRESAARVRQIVHSTQDRLTGKQRTERIVAVAKKLDAKTRSQMVREFEALAKTAAQLAKKIRSA